MDVTVVGSGPNGLVAAVVAVVSEAYRREAEGALAEPAPHASAWKVSARGLRTPLDRDLGWR